MGKVIMSGIVPQLEAPTNFKLDATFANNSWEAIAWACKKQKVPDAWVVGSQKTMTINGKDYLIDIIGKNHDTYTTGGTAPLTFMMHDCYDTESKMNGSATNVGGWASSEMRKTYLPAILSKMPSEVQVAIKEVNKLTSVGNKSSTVEVASDKLFLLSEKEILGFVSYSVDGEGTQYAYYAAGNSRAKNFNGNATGNWWERSPAKYDATSFCYIYGTSCNPGYNSANNSNNLGVSFAFCF